MYTHIFGTGMIFFLTWKWKCKNVDGCMNENHSNLNDIVIVLVVVVCNFY